MPLRLPRLGWRFSGVASRWVWLLNRSKRRVRRVLAWKGEPYLPATSSGRRGEGSRGAPGRPFDGDYKPLAKSEPKSFAMWSLTKTSQNSPTSLSLRLGLCSHQQSRFSTFVSFPPTTEKDTS